jgi:hypothetical protein
MSSCIKYFDLFSRSVTLYTKSDTKVYTYLGFYLSILTFILFGLIFYFEAYEVFKREHPNVVSFKQNINKNKSTLCVNSKTFNFYINLSTNFPKNCYISISV